MKNTAGSGASSSAQRRERLESLLKERLQRSADEEVTERRFSLSIGQRALWLLNRLDPHAAAYNVYFAAEAPVGIDLVRLQIALQRLIQRHPTLRCSFIDADGTPLQVVHPRVTLDWKQIEAGDWTQGQLEEVIADEVFRPFDLGSPSPLRVRVFRRPAAHALAISVHHIVGDYWALSLALDELRRLYEQSGSVTHSTGRAPDYRYFEYAQWQENLLDGPEGERLWSFWSTELSGELPILSLPADRPRPTLQSFRGGLQSFWLDATLSRRIREFAQSEGTTPYVVLLAAYAYFLSRYGGQDDVLVGSPVAGRSRPDFADVIGYFVNVIVLRARTVPGESFRALVGRVRRTVLNALEHQDYPFPQLVERLNPDRDLSHPPVFQAAFALQRARAALGAGVLNFADAESSARLRLGVHELKSFRIEHRRSQFELTLMLEEIEGAYFGFFEYSRDLFDASTVERMAARFRELLAALIGAPEARMSGFPLITADEQSRIVSDWNPPARADVASISLCELIERQARSAVTVLRSSRRRTM